MKVALWRDNGWWQCRIYKLPHGKNPPYLEAVGRGGKSLCAAVAKTIWMAISGVIRLNILRKPEFP